MTFWLLALTAAVAYLWNRVSTLASQAQVLEKLDVIIAKEDAMAGELAALQQKVAETIGIEQSALVLIQGFKAALDAAIAAGNPQALVDLSAQLDAADQALAAGIAANPLPPTP